MQLTEKYRPKRLEQVIGQDKAIGTIRRVLERSGFDRGALWLEGPTGTGKTSMAYAVAYHLHNQERRRADRETMPSWAITQLDGAQCSIDQVRALEAQTQAAGLFAAQWRVWVIDEAHSMTAKAVQAWLTLLERLPARWVIIFTTTESSADLFGNFTQPLLDRTITISLTKQGLSPKFARLARKIATREGQNGQEASAYQRLAQDSHNSMRAMLQAVERGDMMNT